MHIGHRYRLGETLYWSREGIFFPLIWDVPITSMARGIERDVRQMIGHTQLPEARKPDGQFLF